MFRGIANLGDVAGEADVMDKAELVRAHGGGAAVCVLSPLEFPSHLCFVTTYPVANAHRQTTKCSRRSMQMVTGVSHSMNGLGGMSCEACSRVCFFSVYFCGMLSFADSVV